jgi:hypothetical protein
VAIEYIRYRIDKDRREQFVDAYRNAAEAPVLPTDQAVCR